VLDKKTGSLPVSFPVQIIYRIVSYRVFCEACIPGTTEWCPADCRPLTLLVWHWPHNDCQFEQCTLSLKKTSPTVLI